jgi:hypothetical protein
MKGIELIRDGNKFITVIDVILDLGYWPNTELDTNVGNRMWRLFRAAAKKQPDKNLEEKTFSNGSHCFAHYPPDWRPVIEKVVHEEAEKLRQKRVQRARQMSLLDDLQRRLNSLYIDWSLEF